MKSHWPFLVMCTILAQVRVLVEAQFYSDALAQVQQCIRAGGLLDLIDSNSGSAQCIAQACPPKSVMAYQSCVAPELAGYAQSIAATFYTPCDACYQDQGMNLAGYLWLALASGLHIPMQELNLAVMMLNFQTLITYPVKHFTLVPEKQTPLVSNQSSYALDPRARFGIFVAVRIETTRILPSNPLMQALRSGSSDLLNQALAFVQEYPTQLNELVTKAQSSVQPVMGRIPYAFQFLGYAWNIDPTALGSTTAAPSTSKTSRGCAPGCTLAMVQNGVCDPLCFNNLCYYDGGDCGTTTVFHPGATTGLALAGCECPSDWLGDGYCDISCNTTACVNDLGDCVAKPKASTTRGATGSTSWQIITRTVSTTTTTRSATFLQSLSATTMPTNPLLGSNSSLYGLSVQRNNDTNSTSPWRVEATDRFTGSSWYVDGGKPETPSDLLSPALIASLVSAAALFLLSVCVLARRRLTSKNQLEDIQVRGQGTEHTVKRQSWMSEESECSGASTKTDDSRWPVFDSWKRPHLYGGVDSAKVHPAADIEEEDEEYMDDLPGLRRDDGAWRKPPMAWNYPKTATNQVYGRPVDGTGSGSKKAKKGSTTDAEVEQAWQAKHQEAQREYEDEKRKDRDEKDRTKQREEQQRREEKQRQEQEKIRTKDEEQRRKEQEQRRKEEEQKQSKQREEQKKRQEAEEEAWKAKQREHLKKEQKKWSPSMFERFFASGAKPQAEEPSAKRSQSQGPSRGPNGQAGSSSSSSSKPTPPRGRSSSLPPSQERKVQPKEVMDPKTLELVSSMNQQLDAARGLSKDERKKVFKELQRQLHPDKNLGNPEAASKAFQKLMEARNVFLA